jgi:hypothetical protein
MAKISPEALLHLVRQALPSSPGASMPAESKTGGERVR